MAETLTEINQLKMYDTGDNPGAAALNSNAQTIDKKLLNSGPTKPATYPVGAWFVDETLQILYQNTGTHDVPVWTVRVSGGGGGSISDLTHEAEFWMFAG